MKPPSLSIVVPVYNEADGLGTFYRRLGAVLDGLALTAEIIFVNDGSTDDSLARLLALAERDPRVRVVDLSRNFGKEVALAAGLERARGDAVIPIDADLQHPPELIPALIDKWREGFEIVNAVRAARADIGPARRLANRAFYALLDRVTTVPIPRGVGDFRLLSRPVVVALNRLPERTRFMKGLFAWIGFRSAEVAYDVAPRHAGATKWSSRRLRLLAIDAITSFSSVPLKVWSAVGVVLAGLAFCYGAYLVVKTIVVGVDVPGYASVIVLILFLGGIQLISLGVIGEYLGRVYDEVKGRPLYIVRAEHAGAPPEGPASDPP
jgi:glycosyltransferase involved in cell wall biosynthesis